MIASPKSKFEKFELNGKWALITGAAGLLGIQHCQALLEAGANVVLLDIDSVRLTEAQKHLQNAFPESSVIIADKNITIESEIIELQRALIGQGIQIQILINNAAINPKYASLSSQENQSRVENFEISDWDQQIQVGLTGAFICSKIFGTAMASRKSGVIVNIASDLAVIAPDQRIYASDSNEDFNQPVKPVTYSVIKSGLVGLTKYLATYWNKSGVRVNALSPGGIFENQDPEFVEKLTNLIPLGRMARVDEYRSAIQFLSSEASSYMTGQNLIIDGGRTVW